MATNVRADMQWEPTEQYLQQSRVLRLMRLHGIASYDDFFARSIDDPEWFWEAVVRDEVKLEWFHSYERVLDLSDGPAWPHWFVRGRMNYVVNAVDRHARGESAEKVAIRWEGEEGSIRSLNYGDLYREVSALAHGLHQIEVNKGDRVGIFMPMVPETAIATLACSRVGAIYIPCFSGYGPEAVAARLRDADAKALITADGFYRRGRAVPPLRCARP